MAESQNRDSVVGKEIRSKQAPPTVGDIPHSDASRETASDSQKVELCETLQESSSASHHSLKTAEPPGAFFSTPQIAWPAETRNAGGSVDQKEHRGF